MTLRRPALVALALLALAVPVSCGSGSGSSSAGASGVLRLRNVRVDRPALPEQAAVRLVVDNGTATADELVRVTSPDATGADVHRSTIDAEGRDVMKPVERLAIPARSEVTFEPGGLHVMLTGITRDLEVGDTVEVTFTFEHAGRRTATAEVVEPGTDPSEHEHD
jgi:copper(I)-binding protein